MLILLGISTYVAVFWPGSLPSVATIIGARGLEILSGRLIVHDRSGLPVLILGRGLAVTAIVAFT